ncbi:allantoin permease [Scheffersomyces xylosifermentans]|uniref:allantoin permease n=1 Tax=Scheffersomyces xylosifermentans TaxID=1304137 RepID=UPI00315CBF15
MSPQVDKDKSDKVTAVVSEVDHETDSSVIKTDTFWEKVIKKIEVQPKGDLTTAQMFLYNHDLRPVEEQRRQWSWFNYVFFWIADSFNINTWQIAATGIQMGGMNWWQTWISVWLGYAITGIFVSIGARVGIMYHISFPISARSSFGIYGSLWPIFNRVFMSAVWYAVQCSVAGPCFEVMLRAIFGQNLDKTMHDGIGQPDLSTFKFLCFFLFWLFSLPFIWFPPHKIRHLFTVKAVVAPIAGIGFLIWTLVKAGGGGPVLHQPATVSGSTLGWAFVASTMNSLANFATLIVNAPDFSRFATKPSFTMKYLVYSISIPFCFSLTSLIGILVTSASTVMYGTTYWSPLDVLGRFLDEYTPGNRAGVFLIGLSFALAQLGTNISANSLSFGTDVTALLPRFINIRRGGYLCAAIALCICPWKLTSSSSKFTTYLSAYSVFLSSIAGVVACDYFYVRRGYLILTHLFALSDRETGAYTAYRYNKFGINWRAYLAYIAGILPNIVGFVGATGTHHVPDGATKIYQLNFFMGFISAFLVYGAACRLSPIDGVPEVGAFEKGWHETWADVEDFEEELVGHVVHQGIEMDSVAYTSGKYDKAYDA